MGLFSSSSASKFPWVKLTSEAQLSELVELSSQRPVLLFKHSTRCNISAMVLSRFERSGSALPEKCECVYLDLLAHRNISNHIADATGVFHQSPQAILLKDGKAVYDASHGAIDVQKIESLL